MVRLEVINLFPKQDRPKVLANELYNVKIVREARAVARESAAASYH